MGKGREAKAGAGQRVEGRLRQERGFARAGAENTEVIQLVSWPGFWVILLILLVAFFFFFFKEKISLCDLGWPRVK